ncbi:RCC1/BLIP-II [Dothidotthia symphoricarpi CBS 119687]|uniref:RCC1/BLIP-II n=1 Tax=Dothidotthia symphoricarpi CBS 119687 TaxID=1392245 RepID=A0A6A6ANM4_9PLEO|nr:RCC1/BLIP-II [Dothidotthia symphoricarpi CBS 119687]KAF2133390.1 RCC1/BLIP-II [Dothidotthia symphoricarpi CBS 119687]
MAYHLYVFGSNGEGQLGIPPQDIVRSPTRTSNPPPIEVLKSIHGGDNHTLLLTKDGFMYGVGDNRKQQLDPDSEKDHLEHFVNLTPTAISLGAATCESTAYISNSNSSPTSELHTYGSGQWGELGCGDDVVNLSINHQPRSRCVATLPDWTINFAAGVWHYVAVLSDGSVYGWGKARLGQLGDRLSSKVTVPTKIEGIPFRPAKVVCGKDFTYFASDPVSGKHIILGRDKFSLISSMPEHIKCWKDIGATWHAVFVLFDDGRLTAWGKENMWKLIPPNLPPIQKITVGSDHVLAVTTNGKLISWGWGKHGNCGDLRGMQEKMKNDMVSGFWNEISLPGEVCTIGAGYCTSFVVTKVDEEDSGTHE